ncbi:MAG: hypothetical protein ACRDKL_00260 [Solirubrobacteraceae bacterium]
MSWDEAAEPDAWPLDWHGLDPADRRLWFERLWLDVCALRERYRLQLRSGWWASQIQLEALAALCAWVSRYDSGAWDDPSGKLGLLYDLERVAALLREGPEPFRPEHDRLAFMRHLAEIGCLMPDTLHPGHHLQEE